MTLTRYLRPETRVRAKRIGLAENEALLVESKTLGTTMAYNLPTKNLSRTGLLLSGGRYKHVPFRLNTLLEMTVDPHGKLLGRPVTFLGKIVRVAQDGEEGAHFGVHIVQMDGKDEDAWARYVATMEKQQPSENDSEKFLPAA